MRQKWDSLRASLVQWLKIFPFVMMFCGFWMFFPPIIVIASLYLCYVKFAVFGPFAALYLCWFYYSKDFPVSGCMPWQWYRTHSYYVKWAGDYFNYRIVKTAELPADRNYILGSHPHGLTCLGMTFSFAGYMHGIQDLYKGWHTWTVTLAGQFHWPLRREMLMWAGAGSASKQNLQWILGQEQKGQALAIVVGGLNECLMSAPNKYRLKLNDRKGFIKLAITEGADLVPVYHFGETETYEPVAGMCPKRLRNMQAHLMKTFGFCPPFHVGKSLVGLPWGGIVPLQAHLETVIGGSIRVEKNPNPTQAEIDALHAVYCDKLVQLFDTHKTNYGIGKDEKLVLY